MSTILKTLLLVYQSTIRFVFPLTDDEQLLEHCAPEQFKRKLRVQTINGVTTLLDFNDSEVRAAIHLNKFHGNNRATTLLSSVLAQHLHIYEHMSVIIIPIPLSRQRERERGYNQVTRVVQNALKHTKNMILITDVLVRKKHTPPQTSLNRTERLTNMRDVFACYQNEKVAHKHVLIIDDVVTTGATLRAAKEALTPLSPASITCIALAH